MKTIPLTQNKVAMVDDDWYGRLSQYKWTAHTSKKNSTPYGGRYIKPGVYMFMHHVIIGKPPVGMVTDHRDGNGLNNQRDNLRFVTPRENTQNFHYKKTSKFPGVYLHTTSKKWISRIKVGGKLKYLGSFDNEIDAYNRYKEEVDKLEETRDEKVCSDGSL